MPFMAQGSNTLSTHTKNRYGQLVHIYNNELAGLGVLPLFSANSLVTTFGNDARKSDRQQSFRFGMTLVKSRRAGIEEHGFPSEGMDAPLLNARKQSAEDIRLLREE